MSHRKYPEHEVELSYCTSNIRYICHSDCISSYITALSHTDASRRLCTAVQLQGKLNHGIVTLDPSLKKGNLHEHWNERESLLVDDWEAALGTFDGAALGDTHAQ